MNWFLKSPAERAMAERAKSAAPRVRDGSRIYAIGDIHGRADLLAELHDLVLVDAKNAPARRVVIYLGDYVDRGLQSREVLDMLVADPLPDFETVHLKGNHEAALLDFLADARVGPSWVQFGGDATLMSYGAGRASRSDGAADFESTRSRFAAQLPREHERFFRELGLCHEEGDYWFVHAGVRPGIALDRQSPEDLLWIRDDFLRFRGDLGRVIVHGHTITDEPDVRPNRIGIDTGAFASGCLTCVVLEGVERRFLST